MMDLSEPETLTITSSDLELERVVTVRTRLKNKLEENSELSYASSIVWSVEKARLYGYIAFWSLIGVAVVLTKFFSNVDYENNLLKNTFGFNNICINFDYPPSNRVLPVLYVPMMLLMLFSIFLQYVQITQRASLGDLSNSTAAILHFFKMFEGLTWITFSLIFAVSPEDLTTLVIHTVPFLVLMLGLVSMEGTSLVIGVWGNYWRDLELPACFNGFMIVVFALVAIVNTYKITSTCITFVDVFNGELTFMKKHPVIGKVFDITFLVLTAVFPILKESAFLWFKGEQIDKIDLSLGRALITNSKRVVTDESPPQKTPLLRNVAVKSWTE